MRANLKKIIIPLLIILATTICADSVNAIDNITVDSDSIIDSDVKVDSEKLDINFDDEKQQFTFKVSNEHAWASYEFRQSYTHYIDDEVCNSIYSGGFDLDTEKTIKYTKDGTHRLEIKRYSNVLFNVTFNIINNHSTTNSITIQNTKSIPYHIKNGEIIIGGRYTRPLTDGVHSFTESTLTGSGNPLIQILNIDYRGYMVGGVDQRPKSTLSVFSDYSFYIWGYGFSNSYSFDNENIKVWDQESWDGLYDYQYKKIVKESKTKKKPVYGYKKYVVYKWKYYKTKWHRVKIVTRIFKNGKFIFYNSNIEKIRNLLDKNGKIIKTVDSGKKKTVYMKYPVRYYKKVKVHKKKRFVKKYKKVKVGVNVARWFNDRGPASNFATL